LDAKNNISNTTETQTHMLQFRMSGNYIKELEQQVNKLEEEIVELKAKLALQQEDRSTVKRKYKNCTIGMKMKCDSVIQS
jgi:hypothetical protein